MFDSDSVTLKVSGMSCSHCEASVKKAVSSVEGVRSCKASSFKGTVTVKGRLTSETVCKIKEAIAETGFTVEG